MWPRPLSSVVSSVADHFPNTCKGLYTDTPHRNLGGTAGRREHGPTQCSGEHGPTQCSGEHGPTQCSGEHGPTQCSGEHGPTQCSGEHGPTQCLGNMVLRSVWGTWSYAVFGEHGPTQCSGEHGPTQCLGNMVLRSTLGTRTSNGHVTAYNSCFVLRDVVKRELSPEHRLAEHSKSREATFHPMEGTARTDSPTMHCKQGPTV